MIWWIWCGSRPPGSVTTAVRPDSRLIRHVRFDTDFDTISTLLRRISGPCSLHAGNLRCLCQSRVPPCLRPRPAQSRPRKPGRKPGLGTGSITKDPKVAPPPAPRPDADVSRERGAKMVEEDRIGISSDPVSARGQRCEARGCREENQERQIVVSDRRGPCTVRVFDDSSSLRRHLSDKT